MKKTTIRRTAAVALALAAFLTGAQCAADRGLPESLGLIQEIEAGRLIQPAPPDTLVLIQGCPSNAKTALPEAKDSEIPVPPDRKFGVSEIYFFSSTGDSVIEVLKTEVTPEGYVKVFKQMNPGEEYLIIRRRKAPGK
jgi:hypothetical protein